MGSSSSHFLFNMDVCVPTRRMRDVATRLKRKRQKRMAEQHELNTGNALYNTLPAHTCAAQTARVCAACVCAVCVCGVAANVINQTTASPAKPTANQNVQPAAKSTAAGCGRATRGEGAGYASSGIKVPQLRPEGRPSECAGPQSSDRSKTAAQLGNWPAEKALQGREGGRRTQQKVCVSRASARNTSRYPPPTSPLCPDTPSYTPPTSCMQK